MSGCWLGLGEGVRKVKATGYGDIFLIVVMTAPL